MPDNFEMYSAIHATLPVELMRRIAEDASPARFTKRGQTYTYRWPDLTVRVRAVTSQKSSRLVTESLRYIQLIRNWHAPNPLFYHAARRQTPERIKKLLRRMHRTRLVLTIDVEPGIDSEGRTNRLYEHLCRELRPIQMRSRGHAFCDWKGRVILDHFGPHDRKAVID